MASHSSYARIFLVEVLSAGPEASESRLRVRARLSRWLARVLKEADPSGRSHEFEADLISAGLAALVTDSLVQGAASQLPVLAGPILQLIRGILAIPGSDLGESPGVTG
jgi:hypothetical protein